MCDRSRPGRGKVCRTKNEKGEGLWMTQLCGYREDRVQNADMGVPKLKITPNPMSTTIAQKMITSTLLLPANLLRIFGFTSWEGECSCLAPSFTCLRSRASLPDASNKASLSIRTAQITFREVPKPKDGARKSGTALQTRREERFLLSRSSLHRAGLLRGLVWTTRWRWGIRSCSDYSGMLAVCSLSRYGSSCITNKKTLRVKIVDGYPVTSWYGGILALNLTRLIGWVQKEHREIEGTNMESSC